MSDLVGVRRTFRPGLSVAKFSSIPEFLAEKDGVSGVVEVSLGCLPLHFYYDWRGSDTTFVSFAGAISPKVEQLPVWAAAGISAGLGMNRILLSDPSLVLDSTLRLAWYAGNVFQPNLEDQIQALLDGATSGTRVILFGPSGGGFAALRHGARTSNSVVLASNPQTNILKFSEAAVGRYLRIAWSLNSPVSELVADDLPFVSDLVPRYRSRPETQIVYLQNAGDQAHISRHYSPFRDSLSEQAEAVFLMPELGQGHLGPDRRSFVCLLTTIRDYVDWDVLRVRLRRIGITRDM